MSIPSRQLSERSTLHNYSHSLLTGKELDEILPLIEEQRGQPCNRIYGRLFRKVKSGELTQKQFRIAVTYFFED